MLALDHAGAVCIYRTIAAMHEPYASTATLASWRVTLPDDCRPINAWLMEDSALESTMYPRSLGSPALNAVDRPRRAPSTLEGAYRCV
jgi:hypothetical protein